MEDSGDQIRVKNEGKHEGINITPTPGEIAPPLAAQGETATEEEEITAKRITGKLPLSSAVIKPPLRLEGMVLQEVTGYDGWLYTEEDLDDLTALIEQCGIEMEPKFQVIIALVTLHGAKFAAYQAWRKRGRPGDKRAKTEVERKERVGEDVRS